MQRTMIISKLQKQTKEKSKTLNPHALPVTMLLCSYEKSIPFPLECEPASSI